MMLRTGPSVKPMDEIPRTGAVNHRMSPISHRFSTASPPVEAKRQLAESTVENLAIVLSMSVDVSHVGVRRVVAKVGTLKTSR